MVADDLMVKKRDEENLDKHLLVLAHLVRKSYFAAKLDWKIFHVHINPGGEYSGFQVTGMINGFLGF